MTTPNEKPARPLLSVQETLDFLRISRRTLANLTASGRLSFVKIGRAIRFTQDELERFIESSTVSMSYKSKP